MRIVLVGAGLLPIPPPAYGAVEKHIWNLAESLRGLGHEVEIFNTAGHGRLAEYRFALGVRKGVRATDADVLHLHTPGVAAVFGVLGPKRFVYTTHSRHWATREGFREHAGFALERRACRRALQTIAVSTTIAERLAAWGVEASYVPNGVDVQRFRPAAETEAARVVGVGAVAPHKRWHLAAAALRGLPLRLEIVGPVVDPTYAERIRAAAPDQVTLTDAVPEDVLVQRVASAGLMVHPSASEASPMAVIEGMACGLPVVATDLVGDLVRHAENGFVVATQASEAETIENLRRYVQRFLEDPALAPQMGRLSRTRAESEFAWPLVAQRVLAVYERALDAGEEPA